MPAARKPTQAAAAPAPQRPTLGRIVIFQDDRARPRAAVVTATVDTLDESEQLPVLTSPDHVHLTVLAPTGSRTEWNVPLSTRTEAHPSKTWRWPERV